MNIVKKKLGMRIALIAAGSVLATVLVILAVIALWPVSVDYGESELYTRAEIDAALAAVKLDFAKMAGCRLFSLSYAGDELCRRELVYANRRSNPDGEYSDCLVVNAVFRSPVLGGGAWNANYVYHWSWVLVRRGGGPWTVLDKGVL